MTLRLGILISGTGSNMGAILDAIAAGTLDAEVAVVISNKAEAKGLLRARDAGVPTRVLSHKAYADRAAFDRAIVEILREHGVTWVVLAGFMRVVTRELLAAFPDRVINIHPALLPAFPGVDAQAQAIAYGAKVTGCTVHFVDDGVDTGPIIAQEAVPISEGDDRDTLAARLLGREHQLLVEVLRKIADGKVSMAPSLEGERRRVVVAR